jgi:hypothetical protein
MANELPYQDAFFDICLTPSTIVVEIKKEL